MHAEIYVEHYEGRYWWKKRIVQIYLLVVGLIELSQDCMIIVCFIFSVLNLGTELIKHFMVT